MKTRNVCQLVGMAVVILFASSCAGDQAVESPSEVASEVVVSAAAAADTQPAASASPVGAYLNDDGGFEAAMASFEIQVEEQLVRCMAEQGFVYIQTSPEVPVAIRQQGELSRAEWTAEYGYGISTTFESVLATSAADPNTAVILELSPNERHLWTTALAGEAAVDPALALEGPAPLEEQGCIGAALLATAGADVVDGLEEFSTEYGDWQDTIHDHPQMIDALAAWSACMANAGFQGFADDHATRLEIQFEFGNLVSSLDEAVLDLDLEAAREIVDGASDDLSLLPGLDLEALRSLQDREIEMATVDLNCYYEHVQAVFEPLRNVFETELLENFSDELTALREI